MWTDASFLKDNRPLAEKLDEHRFWNTLDVPFESAGIELARKFVIAVTLLQGATNWADIVKIISESDLDPDQADGVVRLLVFCADETPNRFKALFPAWLIQESIAELKDEYLVWPGIVKARPLIEVSKVASLMHKTATARDSKHAFLLWAENFEAENAMMQLISNPSVPVDLLKRIGKRLSQGADTNRSGHGVTTLLRTRLEEWGFSHRIGNSNDSDVAVKALASTYTGPRKYDTVVWNSLGVPVFASQSQMYTSDVGSIQGKNTEQDAVPNTHYKQAYPSSVIFTHTEGFGCHTSMFARLKHVLRSEVDGFIQIRTLDTKLRMILRALKCSSLIDFEMQLLQSGGKSDPSVLIDSFVRDGFDRSEVTKSLKRYIDTEQLRLTESNVIIAESRALLAVYYLALDELMERAKPLAALANSKVLRIGGLRGESALPMTEATSILSKMANFSCTAAPVDADTLLEMMSRRGCVVLEE